MKLSIITINYNNAEGLRETLASVAAQTYRDFEHIIVDGGSTDESVEIIEAYASDMARMASGSVLMGTNGDFVAVDSQDSTLANGVQPHEVTQPAASTQPSIKWISEKDKGIYNAMNKGIEIALGKRIVNSFNHSELLEEKNKEIETTNAEYLLFLNSGDYLVDELTLEKVFEEANDVDIIYGDRINVYEDGSQKKVDYFPDKITGSFMYHSMISHQASFIKSDLFVKYGLYREDLKYASDWEFFLKTFLLYNCTYQHIHQYVVYFDCLGISSIAENNKEMWEERERVFAETLPAFAEDYIHMDQYLRMLRGYDKHANQLGKIFIKPIRVLLKIFRK